MLNDLLFCRPQQSRTRVTLSSRLMNKKRRNETRSRWEIVPRKANGGKQILLRSNASESRLLARGSHPRWSGTKRFISHFRTYFMLPYAPQYTQQQSQVHVPQHTVLQQPQLPASSPTVFSYTQTPSIAVQQPQHYHQQTFLKSLEYQIPTSQPLAPLHTSVDYKNSAPITIVPKKTLPSVHSTSFQQFYSPGLEYHYTEAMPVTKLSPQSSYSYQHAPAHNYHSNYVSQAPSYSYFQSGPSALSSSYNKHQSNGLLESYVPSLVTYARQQQHQQSQQQQYKSYYPTQYHQNQYQQSQYSQVPQQLFTPAQSTQNYAPYPSPQAYNTIQYSVSLPPYEHSKRSTSKATATLNVKAPKSNWFLIVQSSLSVSLLSSTIDFRICFHDFYQ